MDIIKVLSDEELNEVLKTLDVEWSLIPGQGLVRVFETDSFKEGLDLAANIAKVADEIKHYPQVRLTDDEVEVTLITESSGGITTADVELAGAIDGLNNANQD